MKNTTKLYPYTLNHVVTEVNTFYFRSPYRIKKFLEEYEWYFDGIPSPDCVSYGFSIEVKFRKDKHYARFNMFKYVRLSREGFDTLVGFLRYAMDNLQLNLTQLEKSKIYK